MPSGKNGSVITSYWTLSPSYTGSDIKRQGSATLLGQVERIHFVDDSSNVSKRHVEYDVSVLDESGGQTIYKNLRCFGGGGYNDNEETVLEPNEHAFVGKRSNSNFFGNKNGSFVYVAFRDNSLDKPYINNLIDHPRKIGAKREDGIRKLGEFRGVEWSIDKEGALKITYRSARNPDGTLTRASTGPTSVEINRNGVLTISDNEDQIIKVDRVNKRIQVVTKENFEMMVGKDEIVTTTGDRTHTAANHTISSSGDIKIGSDSASEQLVLGNAFTTLYNAHTHIGNLGVPTGTPVVPMGAAQLAARNFTE